MVIPVTVLDGSVIVWSKPMHNFDIFTGSLAVSSTEMTSMISPIVAATEL